MKERESNPAARRNENVLGFVVITVFTAFSSAFFGGILAGMFGDIAAKLIGFQVLWWQGALIGLGVGLVLGAVRAFREIRRSNSLKQYSGQLGLKSLDDSYSEKVESDLRVMLSREVDLIDPHFLSSEGAHIVVGDIRIEAHSDQTPGNSSSNPDPIQTGVLFQFDEFEFPSFSLQPEGWMGRMLDGLMGGQDIDFEDSPLFSKKYLLTGRHKSNVRKLFSKSVRIHFEKQLGLRIVAQSKQLLLYRPGKLCSPAELESFVAMAMDSVDRLQASAVHVKPSPAESAKMPKPRTKEEAIQQLAIGGVVGSMIQHQIRTTVVDSNEMDAFLNQATPRQMVPKELKKRFGFEPIVVLFAAMAMFIGTGLTMVATLGGAAADLDSTDRLIFGLVGPGILLLGGAILGLCWYFRNRKMRVLRSGEVLQGTVTSVSETVWVLGNDRVYHAKFRPSNEDRLINAYLRGCNIQKAKDFVESEQTTRLLYDSAKPDNSLLIECYSI
jgi:hypothetical protein